MAEKFTKPDQLIPEGFITDLMETITAESAVLSLGRRIRVPSSSNTIPVPSSLPDAYWVDCKLPEAKKTSNMEFDQKPLKIGEIAALYPVPDCYLEDSAVPVWSELRPYVAEAVGRTLDQAVLWGTNAPPNSPDALYDGAVAAGNSVDGTGDLIKDTLDTFQTVADDGYNVSRLATAPGFQYKVAAAERGLLSFDPSQPIGTRLFGLPEMPVMNGSWDASKASLIAGDWRQLVVGIRKDITFDFSSTGVIRDTTGKITVSAFQDDCTIMRVTFRAGWQVLNPINALQPDGTKRYPFGVLGPETSPS